MSRSMPVPWKLPYASTGGKMAAHVGVQTVILIMLGLLFCFVEANVQIPVRPISSVLIYGKRHQGLVTGREHQVHHGRRLSFLVEEPPLVLEYHNGKIMTKRPIVPVYIIWYGRFSTKQASTIHDFFSSFDAKGKLPKNSSVKTWWNITAGYKDRSGSAVSGSPNVQGELFINSLTKGLSLTNENLEEIVVSSLKNFSADSNAIYLVLTADNVQVADFCMNSCAAHFSTRKEAQTKGHQLPYVWVGDSGTQCPGECAWPFSRTEYGPPGAPLKAPNGDIGIDGMIGNLAAMLAGSATNPFNNGFYQGVASAPLEAATACTGIYGAGAYPGFPGKLLVNKQTGVNFNVRGINGREFLLPALWSPYTFTCTPP